MSCHEVSENSTSTEHRSLTLTIFTAHLVYPEEAERDHVRTPRVVATRAATGGDAAPVKHDRHVEGALRLRQALWRHHRRTEVET